MVDLEKIYSKNKVIFPKKENVFNFKIDNPKVVILGQDPYHNYNQATGLAFAVPNDVKNPPSLENIFQELKNDLNITKNTSDLTDWKNQGILLLNTSLTVEKNKPGSHILIWEKYTTNYIKKLGKRKDLIWLLLGNHAKSYEKYIEGIVLKTSHPSPFSANMGFIGFKPFSKINNILKKIGKNPINW